MLDLTIMRLLREASSGLEQKVKIAPDRIDEIVKLYNFSHADKNYTLVLKTEELAWLENFEKNQKAKKALMTHLKTLSDSALATLDKKLENSKPRSLEQNYELLVRSELLSRPTKAQHS